MPTVYYKRLAVVTVDADGTQIPMPGETIDVWNVTANSSLGTLVSDADGFLVEGSFTANVGDVIQLSHATYPGTVRLKLTATQGEAYTSAEASAASLVLENNIPGTNESRTGMLFLEDVDNPGAKPIYLGEGEAGTTVVVPFQSSVTKNAAVRLMTKDVTGQQAFASLDETPSASVVIPPTGHQRSVRALFDHYAGGTTLTSSLETVLDGVIPAGTLTRTGDKLRLHYCGEFGSVDLEEFTVELGGVAFISTTAFGGGEWTLDIEAMRYGFDDLKVVARMCVNGQPAAVQVGTFEPVDFGADIHALVKIDDDAAGDTSVAFGYCVFHPAA